MKNVLRILSIACIAGLMFSGCGDKESQSKIESKFVSLAEAYLAMEAMECENCDITEAQKHLASLPSAIVDEVKAISQRDFGMIAPQTLNARIIESNANKASSTNDEPSHDSPKGCNHEHSQNAEHSEHQCPHHAMHHASDEANDSMDSHAHNAHSSDSAKQHSMDNELSAQADSKGDSQADSKADSAESTESNIAQEHSHDMHAMHTQARSDKDFIIIATMPLGEYNLGLIPGARHFEFALSPAANENGSEWNWEADALGQSQEAFIKLLGENKDIDIVFYDSGEYTLAPMGSAQLGAMWAKHLGYKARFLIGGLGAWKDLGFEITTKAPSCCQM